MQVSVSARHAGVYPRRADWCFALRWLLTKQLLDRLLFWQRSLLSKNRRFSFFLLFLWWGGSVSAVSFTSSRLPLRFPLIPAAASVRITAPRHVHRPERASCCLLYPLKVGETGRSGRTASLNIYNLRGSRGVQAKTSLFKHFHIEKYMIVYLKKTLLLPILWPCVKKGSRNTTTCFLPFLSEQF